MNNNTIFFDIAESQKEFENWLFCNSSDNFDIKEHQKNCLYVCIEEELTITQKNYFLKYYLDGWSMDAIAEMFGVSKSTVSRTLKYARNRIARVMRYTSPHLLRKAPAKYNRRYL